MEEIWKDIEGYEGIYQVSNMGKIKSLKFFHGDNGLILKIHSQTNGYLRIKLWKNGVHKPITVHRLVAMAFLENKENYTQVNHIDGIKSNNCISNLEWCSASQNMRHAYDLGLKKPIVPSDMQKRKIKEANSKPIIDLATGVIYDSIRVACKYYKITETHLAMMLRGERPNRTNLIYYNPTNQ